MKHRSVVKIYQPIYDEFGIDRTDAKRRELIAESGHPPSYIELYAALCLEDGPRFQAGGNSVGRCDEEGER